MKTFWGTSFEGEFELFNSQEEAVEFQKELGDEDSEYGVVEQLTLLKPSELDALLLEMVEIANKNSQCSEGCDAENCLTELKKRHGWE